VPWRVPSDQRPPIRLNPGRGSAGAISGTGGISPNALIASHQGSPWSVSEWEQVAQTVEFHALITKSWQAQPGAVQGCEPISKGSESLSLGPSG
jgi:hypothetical protein